MQEWEREQEHETEDCCGLYLKSLSLYMQYSGAAYCNQLTFLAFQENITSPLK